MDKSEYVTLTQFAVSHNVPYQAVLNAIDVGKLRANRSILVDGEPVIDAKDLVEYKFDLIGVYEYAARKGVTYNAVYKRMEAKKNKILYSLDEISDTMKIDWELYKDTEFRSFSFKHRGKNKKVA